MSCGVQRKSTIHEMQIVKKPNQKTKLPHLSYYPVTIYIGYIDIHACIYKYISWSKYYVAYVNCYGVSPFAKPVLVIPWKSKII
jgi:hypothetical protein